jgi:hypothetical protein
MTNDRIEIELRKIRTTNNWFIGVSIAILLLIVGGWARADIKIQANDKDLEYLRMNALNKKAFYSHTEAQDKYQESISKIVQDENLREVINYFNNEMKKISDKIDATETEIVPRGIEIKPNKNGTNQ